MQTFSPPPLHFLLNNGRGLTECESEHTMSVCVCVLHACECMPLCVCVCVCVCMHVRTRMLEHMCTTCICLCRLSMFSFWMCESKHAQECGWSQQICSPSVGCSMHSYSLQQQVKQLTCRPLPASQTSAGWPCAVVFLAESHTTSPPPHSCMPRNSSAHDKHRRDIVIHWLQMSTHSQTLWPSGIVCWLVA